VRDRGQGRRALLGKAGARLRREGRIVLGLPPVTQWLLIANVAVYVLEQSGAGLGAFALWPPGNFESRFEIWQLVTYSFLHANLAHIFFNMFALYMFGGEIERLFGSRFYALYYL